MSRPLRPFIIVLVVCLVLAVSLSVAYATDNTTSYHWHSESPTFRLLADQLPDSWEGAIREAAEAWHERTDITLTESSSSGNTIYRGTIPSSWQAECPPDETLACTRSELNSSHIQTSTMVFNEEKSMGTSSFNCALDIGKDVQTIALHEFGHFAGWLEHSSDSDAAMYGYYNGCQRTPDEHDVDSMNEQYDNHP